MIGRVVIKSGREKPILQRHPWVFSGAIERVDDSINNGDVADIVSGEGEFLARGYVNRQSQIVVRILTWNQSEAIDNCFWLTRIGRAVQRRSGHTLAVRLVNAEADGLPGLIVDRYGDWLVIQSLTRGMETFKKSLVGALVEITKVRGVYERSDVGVREKEGLAPLTGVLYGPEPPEEIEISELGCNGLPVRFLVNVRSGHKTGCYLDQRDNRPKVAAYCKDRCVLNVFSYTGGFAVHALAGGACRVINVDASREALLLARKNVALNGFAANDTDFVQEDAFTALRKFRAEGNVFDVVILDPPKFAPSLAHMRKATRAYKDLNLVALRILPPGGFLVTFSCSGMVTLDLFQKIVFGASVDAKREVQIVERLSQSQDHPVLLSFPEGEYLKGLVCKVW